MFYKNLCKKAPTTVVNYKCRLTTYNEPALQNIQLWFIKSESIQTVEIARLLKFNCTFKPCVSVSMEQAELL